MKTGVVDYSAGNLTSVKSALNYLGADYFVSDNPEELIKADKLIFPGVGEAAYAMGVLKSKGLDKMLIEFAASGKYILGICLGAQIVLGHSEERDTDLLNLIEGNVVKFPTMNGFKIPHMGWNSVSYLEGCPIFKNIPQNSSFYFVHSYYMKPANLDDSCAETDYCIDFTSAVRRNNIFATQFHPEKSGVVGLKLLENFLELE